MLAGMAALTGALLWLIGFPRRLWTVAATALTLGATGYAWQGSPGLAGHPVSQEGAKVDIAPDLIELRDAMFGRFGFEQGNFMRADAMTRAGAPRTAVFVMQDAVIKAPNNVAAWTGLGTTLSEHDKGVSPAARFAFDRAIALSPKHPGPPFFLGLAYIRAGQFAEARRYWALAAQLAPETAPYREELIIRLGLLDRFIQEQAANQ
jgi:tetratricopeptide (TPR) repeat protein